MKIALVRTASNILRYGGYNIQEIGLAKSLMVYGVTTDVYARFSNIDVVTEIAKDEKGNKVVIHPLKGKQIWHELMYYPTLKQDLLNGGYDMVQLLDDSQMMLPSLFKALKRSGVKTILWQGMYRDFNGKIAHAMQLAYDMLYAKTLNKYSDLKIAKTEAAKEYLVRKKYKNIIVLPVGLDEVVMNRDMAFDSQIENFKRKHPNLLIYIGAIEPRRNPNFLVNLMERKKSSQIGLIMIGKGNTWNETAQLVKAKRLEDRIMMIDAVPNNKLISVYERADMFLLPTSYEIYGMVVMESLSYGVPVISTPEAGPSYLLPDKQLGFCESLDEDKWSSAIDFYLTNYTTDSDRKARVAYVNNNFRWPKIAKEYYKVINKLLKQN